MTIKIDEDIPIPAPKAASAQKYPWNDMKVGSSFPVVRERVPRGGVALSGRKWAERHEVDWCFVEEYNEDGSLRVWRTK